MQKTYELMAKKKKREYRLQSKSCNIMSMHPTVLEADVRTERLMNNPSHMLDIKVEMTRYQKTQFQSYAEILVFSRLSTSIWDDSINLSWEQLQAFFQFFGHQFEPNMFMRRNGFSKKEKFIFYNMIGECLTLDPIKNVELYFDLNNLVASRLLYDRIYLNLQQHYYEQIKSRDHFYYPDILNNLAAQINPRVASDTVSVNAFLNKQEGYNHFSVKAVWAYHPEKAFDHFGKPKFDPSSFDFMTFPFLQDLSHIRRQNYVDTFIKLYKNSS